MATKICFLLLLSLAIGNARSWPPKFVGYPPQNPYKEQFLEGSAPLRYPPQNPYKEHKEQIKG